MGRNSDMKQHHLRASVFAFACAVALTTLGCPSPPGPPVAGETRVFDGIEFQWCPPGSFAMGSPLGEQDRESGETLHGVTLTQGFWLSKYELTQAQWEAVMGSNPSLYVGPDNPVEHVSWNHISDFLVLLNFAKSGATYRLPTEAEWEYACRAGTSTRRYWGDDLSDTQIEDYAWHYENSGLHTHPVGQKLPNNWGLYDVIGNVSEWCHDWEGEYPLGPVTDPQGPDSGSNRVYRGGSCGYHAPPCRSAKRSSSIPASYGNVGFRLLRTAD
jgi:formylglycine-generating enzyme required for sulfatase activity